MTYLGMAPLDVVDPAPNHSIRMLIDEGAMPIGAAMHVAMATAPLPDQTT